MALISVIIPAYNAEEFLEECLESLLRQDFQDWEGIVVDDGSTDNTFRIATRYSDTDPRIKVFRKENGGVSAARNFGMEKASGEWITFLDSDDCLYTYSLSAFISASEGVEMVAGSSLAGSYFKGGMAGEAERSENSLRIANSSELLLEMLYQTGVDVSVWGKLYKASLVKSLPFSSGRRFEDLEHCAVLFSSMEFRVRVIPDIVYFYRTNPSSFINTFNPGRMDVLAVTEEIENLLKDTPAHAAARERRLSANFNIFSLLCVHDRDGRYLPVKEKCWEYICSHRMACLQDTRTRLRSKAGAALSFLGKNIFSRIAAHVYRGR